MKTLIINQYQRIKGFYAKYERILVPVMLIGGFLLDYITFSKIQIGATLALLFTYWFLAGAVIVGTHTFDAGKLPDTAPLKYARLFAPLALQFAFGALLGSSLIFYWFSGAFSVSWPLMLAVVLLMVFNDRFRHYVERPLAQISIYFFCTISLFSLALPLFFTSLSAWLFVAATAVSAILFLADLHIASHFLENIRLQKRRLMMAIIIIAGGMNALYFTNIIPPIPLALREAGLYHSLTISNGKYIMLGEPESIWRIAQDAVFGQTAHIMSGSASAAGKEKIYLYTAIFAPARLKTTIVHHWQYYDAEQKKWVDRGVPSFAISGGRQAGYKGYSWQNNLAEGKWRVYVENLRGQVLARVRFTVERVDAPVELREVIR